MGDIQNKYISFKVGNEIFAASIDHVREIIKMTKIVKIPKSPDFIKGVINLRGKIIPVIDLKVRFGMKEDNVIDNSRIIISEINDILVGFIVDTVLEVLQIEVDSFESTPPLVSEREQNFVTGVIKRGNTMILVLDVAKVLSEEETEKLKDIN